MPSEIFSVSEIEIPEIAEKDRDSFASLSEMWTEAIFRSQLPDAQHSFLALRDEKNALCGYVCLSHVCEDSEIVRIAVFPAYRRRGHAAALLEAAAARAAECGAQTLFLEVRASNEPALALYKSHGFSEYGRRKDYYKKEHEDAVLMKRVLNPSAGS